MDVGGMHARYIAFTLESPMKVLVTGATGFVGREIVRQLHAAGHTIRILARSPHSPRVQEAVSRCGAEVHPGDVLDAASLDGALNGMDAVIHLVGIISEVGESTFENVHTRGTGNMVAAARQAGVRRFVHMSALGTRPNAVSRYHQTKWAAEELVRHSGLDFTIFRPSLIYGPEDQFVNLFARMIRLSPVVPLMGSPRARFQPVPVETVAAAFVRIAGRTEVDRPDLRFVRPGGFDAVGDRGPDSGRAGQEAVETAGAAQPRALPGRLPGIRLPAPAAKGAAPQPRSTPHAAGGQCGESAAGE